ncbi:MAG: DUF4125 family protein [Lachnospiraceae bacterium]|nr:DUF4125 family protein [Lachnospiraceae bacterium]
MMAEISEREQLIFDVSRREWEMFQNVYNTGGRASCQDDPDTFYRMRMSQWMVYSDELLKSYQRDCETAVANGRNLIFEKYARMMETTYPEEFEKLLTYLPEISLEKDEKIEEIVKVHLEWDREVAEKYPKVRGNGRTATTKEDSVNSGSSMESYLRAEIKTYSDETLNFLYRETMNAYKKGDNLLEQIIANETAFYGYQSLKDAESKM